MLKRIRIRGYKSLRNFELRLPHLVVLFGPNAAGKSNFLDALQLLAKLGTGPALAEAFDPPHRGAPLESFSLGPQGVEGLLAQEKLSLSLEADLYLSDLTVEAINRQAQAMRSSRDKDKPAIRERDLRYRIEIEMRPQTGTLRVADEYLTALNAKGEPSRRRKAFIERQGDTLHLHQEGQAHSMRYDRYLGYSLLSMPHNPLLFPHAAAVQRELNHWLFFYLEPRVRMHASGPLREKHRLGPMGEDLAPFLHTLHALHPRRFAGLEKALRTLIPKIEGIHARVNEQGHVELHLRENGAEFPATVLSEGTLRMLGLLALAGTKDAPALVGFEEPENGIHPRQIELIASFLNSRDALRKTQYIVTTHSPILPDLLAEEALFAVRCPSDDTRIDPISVWGSFWRGGVSENGFRDDLEPLPISERILRGDFDA